MARGGNVAIFDLNAERGGEIVSELGDQTAFFECNVMEEESIDAAVAGAHEKFGALHGAVNCAGGSFGGGLCVNRRGEATDMETWWKTVQLNLYKRILERCYGLTVHAMYLAQFHPDLKKYHCVEVPPLVEMADKILTERED